MTTLEQRLTHISPDVFFQLKNAFQYKEFVPSENMHLLPRFKDELCQRIASFYAQDATTQPQVTKLYKQIPKACLKPAVYAIENTRLQQPIAQEATHTVLATMSNWEKTYFLIGAWDYLTLSTKTPLQTAESTFELAACCIRKGMERMESIYYKHKHSGNPTSYGKRFTSTLTLPESKRLREELPTENELKNRRGEKRQMNLYDQQVQEETAPWPEPDPADEDPESNMSHFYTTQHIEDTYVND